MSHGRSWKQNSHLIVPGSGMRTRVEERRSTARLWRPPMDRNWVVRCRPARCGMAGMVANHCTLPSCREVWLDPLWMNIGQWMTYYFYQPPYFTINSGNVFKSKNGGAWEFRILQRAHNEPLQNESQKCNGPQFLLWKNWEKPEDMGLLEFYT